MVLATLVFVFTVAWCALLWVVICCPRLWARIVDAEHEILAKTGILPRHWLPSMRRLETGVFLKVIIALTIGIALLVQYFL